MLERIRRHRPLGTMVLAASMLLWLTALSAGVQVRLALSQFLPGMEVCTASPHEAQAPHAAPDSAPGGHTGHHDAPGCLLCIALGTPPALTLAVFRPPVPVARQTRRGPAQAAPAWRAQAPLPARGPPAPLHA